MEGTFVVQRRRLASTAAIKINTRLKRGGVVAAAIALVCLAMLGAMASSAAAETATYSATETIPVPPASHFAGSGGGDGWAVALSEKAVFNVFHHDNVLQVACHQQSDAEVCKEWPKTISEPGGGSGFATAAQPGLYLDQHTGKLYVYGTRLSDSTAGVVCVDTTSEEADPFCGFTELTQKGEAPLAGSISGVSDPMLIGKHWYAFNYVSGEQKGAENNLLCFDVSTDAACAGQPYSVAIGSGEVSTASWPPAGATAAIAGKAIIPLNIGGTSSLACFDDSTMGNCAGKWPLQLGFGYTTFNGAPFPMLNATGATVGLCLPTGIDQCFNLEGESAATPEHMSEVIGGSDGWNGPAFVLGPRVYVPNGNANQVACFDYSTGAGCAKFPKSFENLGYLYTVNQDPQRPTCIWVNSDDGSDQIQNFDAYTGEACGEGTIRVLASQFVVAEPQCTPASYVSLQVLRPGRNTYASGSVAFADGDGNPIGIEERALDETGTASLAGLQLNTPTGLPEFLFTLNGETEQIGVVEVKLTWVADYDKTCIREHTTVTAPPAPAPETKPVAKPQPPKAEVQVLAFRTAHLANGRRACVASSRYLASVSGKDIASVTFTLDGRKLKTVTKANSHGAFTLKVPVKAGQIGHLTIHVKFTSAARNHSQTIKKTLARCAVVHHVSKPRFTG